MVHCVYLAPDILSVCLSVSPLAYLKMLSRNFAKFSARVTCMAMARSSSDDSGILTSSIVVDAIISINEPYGACSWQY